MTEDDPLEVELAALRPQEPSPEVRHRIAVRLSADSDRRMNRWISVRRAGVLAAGLTAAGFAFFMLRPTSEPPVNPRTERTQIESQVTGALNDSLPSLWKYRNAFNQSPEALENLLNQHAQHHPEFAQQRPPVIAFAHFDRDINSLLGEHK